MARKFLYVFAALIVLVIAGGFAFRLYGPDLMRAAMVPSTPFSAQPALPKDSYARADMWFARAGKKDDPTNWQPTNLEVTTEVREGPAAATFFLHPTSFIDRSAWNAPLDDQTANDRARIFLRGQASVFRELGPVWAPRYRQATFGAFLTSEAAAQQALDLAYRDVAAAFDQFLAENPKGPVILAGHSQGALHLMRLLREKVAGTPLARRVVAAYVIGWPISRTIDLPALGMPACKTPDEAGCVLSWQSFAEPAETSAVVQAYAASKGPDGTPRAGTPMLCTNPLTGKDGGAAPASANFGTLRPAKDLASATIEAGLVPARCDPQGFLLIGAPPEMGNYVLPGNNYHVYDYSLFWANVRADAARRLATFSTP